MNLDHMYDLAFKFNSTEIWKSVYEDELFAVKFSDDRIKAIGKGGLLQMKKAMFLITLIAVLGCGAFAESILPSLTEPKEDVVWKAVTMPSLEQVSWYDYQSVTKNNDGRIAYHYSNVSENAYQMLGVAMSEAGYTLKSNTTDANGYMHFIAGDDANEMEIVYHEIGGAMDILYPENALLTERDEEALTIHLQLGEPFRETDDCVFSLEAVNVVSEYRHEYQSGWAVLIRDSEIRKSTNTCQYIMLGYACKNKAVYDIDEADNHFYYGKLEYDPEEIALTESRNGGSDEAFSYVCSYATPWVKGNSTRYYAQPIYYDPSVYSVPIQFTVTFFSKDRVIKYVYDITIGESKSPEEIACPSCGEIYPADFGDAFCSKCGAALALIDMSGISIGDIVTFGHYEQDNDRTNGAEPIEWIVLDKGEQTVTLISQYGLDVQMYNVERKEVTWETCTLRAWLNESFPDMAFSPVEQALLRDTKVTADKNPNYDTEPGNDTEDKVYLLSVEEAVKYFTTDDDRICQPTQLALKNGATHANGGSGWWWLRSPGSDQRLAANIHYDGSVFYGGNFVEAESLVIRPVIVVAA